MADVRLCRDCRWIKDNAYCFCPRQPVFDLVHGAHPTCNMARMDGGKLPTPDLRNCGPIGQWFEPKEE